MEAKDLLAANRKQAEIMYKEAKKAREAAEEAADFAKKAVEALPPGDEQNDAMELADHTAAEVSAATIKENNAKEFWDKAVEAEKRYLSEPSTRKTSGSKDIAKEEQRKADETAKMAAERKKEIDAEEKRKAEEAERREEERASQAEGEAGRKEKSLEEQDRKQR